MTQHLDPSAGNSKHHRCLFLSDLHLGSISCRADLALEFLHRNHAERYVLVGDILDLWRPMQAFWTPAAQAVVDHLMERYQNGADLVYITGNHDPAPDTAYEGRKLPVPAQTEATHVTSDGRRFLVVHGDSEDHRLFRFHSLTRLGTWLDHGLRRLDQYLCQMAWRASPARRSVIEWMLSGMNAALYPTRAHERNLVALARRRGLDGVICGHFHLSALNDDHGLIYANCGDWVDSFTALAEDFDGNLDLLGGRREFAARVQPGYSVAGAGI